MPTPVAVVAALVIAIGVSTFAALAALAAPAAVPTYPSALVVPPPGVAGAAG